MRITLYPKTLHNPYNNFALLGHMPFCLVQAYFYISSGPQVLSISAHSLKLMWSGTEHQFASEKVMAELCHSFRN